MHFAFSTIELRSWLGSIRIFFTLSKSEGRLMSRFLTLTFGADSASFSAASISLQSWLLSSSCGIGINFFSQSGSSFFSSFMATLLTFLTGINAWRTSWSTTLQCFRISDNNGSSISGLSSGRMMLIFSAVSRTISKLSSSSSGLWMGRPESNNVPLYMASRRDVPRLKKPVWILVLNSWKVSVKEARRGCSCLILGSSCNSQKKEIGVLRGSWVPPGYVSFSRVQFLEFASPRLSLPHKEYLNGYPVVQSC